MLAKLNKYHIPFFVLLIGFVISKCTHLDVPYFWDESWVYAPAVNVMADLGPTMYAGSFPLEHSRGHPLFFHFLGGSWISIFGNSLISLHTFALTISVGFICLIYVFIRSIISTEVALVTIALLIFQPLFYAQSSIVLPEILLSLLCFLSMIFLYQKKWFAYFLAGSLAIWTKESTLAFILCLVCAHGLSSLKHRNLKFKELVFACLPLLSFALFIGLNKVAFDFYLYPEHTGMLTFELSPFIGKLKAVFLNIFYDQKRWLLGLIALVAIGYLSARQSSIFKNDFLIYLLIPVLGFAMFSALNFYTVRYVLAIFPLAIVTMSWLIVTAAKHKPAILWLTIIAIMCHSIIQLFDRRSVRDINLSYLDYGPAQLEVIKYFEENELYDQSIHTGFLTATGLTNQYAGYRSSDPAFTTVNKEMSDDLNYFVFSSTESHHLREQVISNANAQHIKTITKGNANFEIYLLRGKL